MVWGAFSLVATVAQWSLEESGSLTMLHGSRNTLLSASILIAAGAWQLTPMKQTCLRHCRSPLHFLVHGFRPGAGGALRMGAEHGLFCLGCCWFLMALLFYGGVMNLYWIAGLAVYVLIEKTVPAGHFVSRVTGIVLLCCGGWLLFVAGQG
jgi:predicted metal-binding membrane protein